MRNQDRAVVEGAALRKRQVQGQQQDPGDEEQNAESSSEGLHGAYLPLFLILLRSTAPEHRHGDLVLIPRYVSAKYKPDRRDEKEYQSKLVGVRGAWRQPEPVFRHHEDTYACRDTRSQLKLPPFVEGPTGICPAQPACPAL